MMDPTGYLVRHNRNFQLMQKIDDRGVVENSNFGAW